MIDLVGRERETARLAAALAAGRNGVVSGKFGSGRTALVRHLAETSAGRLRFAFCDFAEPPRNAWAALAAELVPERRPSRAKRRVGSKTLRARVLEAPLAGGPPVVVVLDDVGRLTPARLDVVRRLSVHDRFQLLAIVEGHLPAADRRRLLAWLAPVERLRLGPLPQPVVRDFFARVSAERGLGWGPEKIAAVASGTGGHPLSMRLALEREVERARERTPARGRRGQHHPCDRHEGEATE